MLKVIFFGILAVIAFLGLLALAGYVFYEMVLNASIDKEFIMGPYVMNERMKKDEAKFRLYHPKDIFMTSHDGLRLHAIEVVQNPDKWVILVHGYMGSSSEMIDAALEFLKEGYSVLLPNHRGHHRSEGRQVSMGIKESQDVAGWVNDLVCRYPKAEVFLLGVSMGAASVMLASEKNLPKNVKAIVEDCGYTSAMDEFAWQLKKLFKLPKFPLINAADYVTRLRGRLHLKNANPIEAIQNTDIPILFVHGDADDFVPTHMVYKLYQYANYPKDLLIIQGGKHAIARLADPDKYYKAVLSWFKRFSSDDEKKMIKEQTKD